MAGAHDDAVEVGGGGVGEIVFVEGVVPHGGPHVISLGAQEQLKHVGIELVAVVGGLRIIGCCAVLGADIVAEGRCLVIKKDAAVFHRGLSHHVFAALHIQLCVFLGRHICPVIPGGLA